MQQNNTTKVAQASPTVGTTLNVPKPIWKRLRLFAAQREVSQQSIWLEALAEYLGKRAA